MSETESQSRENNVPVDFGFVCTNCSERWYYTRRRCPACHSDTIETYKLGRGTVVTTTLVTVTPPDVREPNDIGLVRFGAVSLIAQLSESGLSAGDTVAFEGDYRLRSGDRQLQPRLTPID